MSNDYQDDQDETVSAVLEMLGVLQTKQSEFKSKKIEEHRTSNINNSKSNKIKINIKRINNDAIIPTRGTTWSAGYDLYSCIDILIKPGERQLINTGLSMEIPENYVGLICDRSSYSFNYGLQKGAGVIDSDYRGEIKVLLFNHSNNDVLIKMGDRCAQLLIMPIITPYLEECVSLHDAVNSERNESGFGSTGK